MFSQDRRIVSLGVRAEYARRYYVDLSYTTFNANARFDSFHDRDFYGMVLLTSSDGGRSFVVMPQKVLLRKLRSFSFDADKRAVIAVGVGGASSLTFDFPEK